MALPQFSMRDLIDAGVHYGHKTKRWNPRMQSYLYGVRNDVHIIDLQQTVPLLHAALRAVREAVVNNGRILFVGTKRQAADPVAEAAKRCGQYYINQRWLGGMLTNWKTVQNSIKMLRTLDEQFEAGDPEGYTKKEVLSMQREREKLEKSLGGIKNMNGLPSLIFIIDTNKEDLAVKEAAKLGIPIVAILDSNSTPDGITFPIPGNDDATRAIKLYCQLISDAVLDGIQETLAKSGVDFGAATEVPFEQVEAIEGKEEPQAEKQRGKGGKPAKKAPAVVTKPSIAKKLKDKADAEAETAETEALETEAAEAEDASEGTAKSEAKKPAVKKTATKKSK